MRAPAVYRCVRSANGGGDWSRAGTGLPKVPVYEIALDIDRGRLYAGTHGRGAFSIDLSGVPGGL